MNIKCKNCSGENPVGSMFCRLCGAKLSFEEIDADIKKNIKRSESRKILRSIYRIISIIFIIFVFYIIFLMLDPFQKSMAQKNILTKEQETQTVSIMSTIDSGKKGTFTISSEQLDFLARRYLGSKDRPVSAGIYNNKYIRLTYSEVYLDYYVKIQISKSAIMEPVILKNGKGVDTASLNLKYVKVGNLTLPQYLGDFIADDFKPFASNSKVTRIARKINRINISGNNIELIAE